MNALSIAAEPAHDMIHLSNEFIDQYITKANGDFIKVYLYVLRHIEGPSALLSLSKISEVIGQEENDVYRALKFWVNEGKLKIIRDDLDHICSIQLIGQPEHTTSRRKHVVKAPAMVRSYTEAVQVIRHDNREIEWKRLVQTAPALLNRNLTPMDVEVLDNLFKNLNMSYDLIIHLLETCVDRGKTSCQYIQKVGLNWVDEGITTIEEANVISSDFTVEYSQIKHAFGIKDRRFGTSEVEIINRWFTEFNYTIDIILEACNQTLSKLTKADFKYTNKILQNWYEAGYRTLAEIKQSEETFAREKKTHKKTYTARTSSPKNNSFSNFTEREYDNMDELERLLIKSNCL